MSLHPFASPCSWVYRCEFRTGNRVTALLDRHKAFVVRGFDTDGVREALVVVKNGTDADIEAYLHTFEQRVAKFKALSALLRAESK